MKRTIASALVVVAALLFSQSAFAANCTATGFFRDGINMTAAKINPAGTVKGVLDARGCNIGVYYSAGATGVIKNADIFGSNYFGVLVNGDDGVVQVDIINSSIHNIGEVPHNGTQHGAAIYYRGFFDASVVTGTISGNKIFGYQKGGIVINGSGVQVDVTDNEVTGDGHVYFIAMNGIQVGYGASGSVTGNTVSGNSFIGYPGDGSASGGIIVVGGPGYGLCPDGKPCPLTTNLKIMKNTLIGNDVGVYLSNLEADFSAPMTATNIKVVNNDIANNLCFNTSYQAAVSDQGNNDKIINNDIRGVGYAAPCGFAVDADKSFTNKPKVHANK